MAVYSAITVTLTPHLHGDGHATRGTHIVQRTRLAAETGSAKSPEGTRVQTPPSNPMMLLPPNLAEMIPPHHLVRVVNKTIDGLNLEPLLATYEGRGASVSHPRMLLKVLVYAYVSKFYSSHRIAKALREELYLPIWHPLLPSNTKIQETSFL